MKLDELKVWYSKELAMLRKRSLEIMQTHDQAKTALLKQDILKKIKDL